MLNDEVNNLKNENKLLKERITYLESLLDENHISYTNINAKQIVEQKIKNEEITQKHVIEFYRFFKARKDVYSLRNTGKDGKTAYYTQCQNFWKENVCLRRDGKKIRCKDCAHKKYKMLKGDALLDHFNGKNQYGKDIVVGIYPMFSDETTNLLVFDFDNHDVGNDDGANVDNGWKEEVNALRKICQMQCVDCLVERSRSGKGAHVWIFFEEAIPAYLARKFGKALLTIGSESINLPSFKTYDRMIPNQDHLDNNGIGNTVALPLQAMALKNGNSAFIDENWNVYYDQWECIRKVNRIPKQFVEQKIDEWGEKGILKINNDYSQDTIPWVQENPFNKSDVDGELQIYLFNMIYISKSNVNPRLQNKIRKLGTFSNREFYKKLRTGLSVRGLNSIVQCSYDKDDWICLPRGCLMKLINCLDESQIKYSINDERIKGSHIDVEFNGELYDKQKQACEVLLSHENGVLNATTAFGKTVVGTYLISQRKINTLIIVPSNLIMNNWEDDLSKFLICREEMPIYQTPSGKIRKRKSVIGKLYSGHNSLTGIIDIAIVNSLWNKGEVKELVKNYGMIIVDECHHAASPTVYDVLNEIPAQYMYGFSATPKREDSLEQKIYMQLGPIRYKYTTKERLKEQGIPHYIYPRFTRFVHKDSNKLTLNETYPLLIKNETRNNQIFKDIDECIENGRTSLVLTKSREHACFLYNQLQNKCDRVILLMGKQSRKEKDKLRNELKEIESHESVLLIATAQYAGEGFNFPRLDTLFLVAPISVENSIEQYLGRLHRDYQGKKDVIIYDYIDSHIKVLKNMSNKRMKTYKKMGYEICQNISLKEDEIQMIYDSYNYQKIFDKDVQSALKEIYIVSPGLSKSKVHYYLQLFIPLLENGVEVKIKTLDYHTYSKNMITRTEELIHLLINNGINVQLCESLYDHYAIIDNEITWYGSMNLLSNVNEEDNMIRICDKQVVFELLTENDEK